LTFGIVDTILNNFLDKIYKKQYFAEFIKNQLRVFFDLAKNTTKINTKLSKNTTTTKAELLEQANFGV
jgi:BioD-like phosphotransacetylase family protein